MAPSVSFPYITCGFPANILNAQFISGSYTLGGQAIYECTSGYVINGSSPITNSSAITCFLQTDNVTANWTEPTQCVPGNFMQKKCIMNICIKPYIEESSPLFKESHIPKMADIRPLQLGSFCINILMDTCLISYRIYL